MRIYRRGRAFEQVLDGQLQRSPQPRLLLSIGNWPQACYRITGAGDQPARGKG